MTWYKLIFGGTEFGDELILGAGYWKSTVSLKNSNSGLETIASLDDRPLAIGVYPRFRIRKTCDNQWLFERWIFDLLGWADGGRRVLCVTRSDAKTIANYGECKLISVDRTVPEGPQSGRWSDEVVLSFQADGIPQFFNL